LSWTRRFYREQFAEKDLTYFQVVVKETDLYVGVLPQRFSEALALEVRHLVAGARSALEEYIARNPAFLKSLEPLPVDAAMPSMAREMAVAAGLAGVGPMAAVAGAFSDLVGRMLMKRSRDVVVENGGDIYLKRSKRTSVGIFAGNSPFSNRIALDLTPDLSPLGICTSSGTVGPSLSFGCADAAVILAETATLADAVATATANRVQDPADIEQAAQFAGGVPGVLGALVICGDRLAAWGKVKLRPL